mmetsp:Transcript_20279/g.42270  ORF Transcript_20279/g.42270 Transcript_20279/m.42270 type:complete len:225 (-) Transcript_20279:1211-1885(-)
MPAWSRAIFSFILFCFRSSFLLAISSALRVGAATTSSTSSLTSTPASSWRNRAAASSRIGPDGLCLPAEPLVPRRSLFSLALAASVFAWRFDWTCTPPGNGLALNFLFSAATSSASWMSCSLFSAACFALLTPSNVLGSKGWTKAGAKGFSLSLSLSLSLLASSPFVAALPPLRLRSAASSSSLFISSPSRINISKSTSLLFWYSSSTSSACILALSSASFCRA